MEKMLLVTRSRFIIYAGLVVNGYLISRPDSSWSLP